MAVLQRVTVDLFFLLVLQKRFVVVTIIGVTCGLCLYTDDFLAYCSVSMLIVVNASQRVDTGICDVKDSSVWFRYASDM